MSEKILKALMRLFAIIAEPNENNTDARTVVESYLKQLLNKEQVKEYIAIYDDYLKTQKEEGLIGEKKRRRVAVSSVKVIVICEQINEELTHKQKFIVLLNLIEFVNSNGTISEQEMEFTTTVSAYFNIPEHEFQQCLELVSTSTISEIKDSPNVLIIGNKKSELLHPLTETKFLHSDSIIGELAILRNNSAGIYLIRYFNNAELFLNGQIITPGKIYILSQGSSIRSSKVQPIYYSDIIGYFLKDTTKNKITFYVNEIEYRFKKGKIGLHPLSFIENSGKLYGIMGGSGAGKSTLINILNGNNNPYSGNVLINGDNLHKEKKKLEGVIGYIPQGDFLIEELTVYQNLFYNSKLCFANYSKEQIDAIVVQMLHDLGLYEIKDLKVGNSLNKSISGGQRKRLNIALELVREPSILFIDEPTSGLSSKDSENIMDLLKELALKGKLIFVVIHQPSSDIFKMFDKLLILDVGGYPIYNGNPVEALVYFKTIANQVNANNSECITCGNVNPEQLFNIIESKVIDENGHLTRNRKISPKEWNEYYLSQANENRYALPEKNLNYIKNTFKKPNFFNQLKVFSVRDILSKLSNTQYLIINFLEAPLLAFILATLIKYFKNGDNYLFSENKNIPAYIFLCVIVSLFIGLTVSAEEIIKDQKILKRESFLNLSKGSYLLSKILILFCISAIQTVTFVLIGNYILEIKGMYFDYWMVLFTTSCFANMLGLNISSAFNSVVTIYILIPFLLIPQILLSGVIVKFEELNPKISNLDVVPISGELMASRWAFEALAVNQFINNEYEKNIYAYDKEISYAGIKKVYWFSKMNELADEAFANKNALKNLDLIKHEILSEQKHTPEVSFDFIHQLNPSDYNQNVVNELKEHLKNVKKQYTERYNKALKSKDLWIQNFQEDKNGQERYSLLMGSHQNNKLEDLVKNHGSDLNEVVEGDKKLIITTDPIFRDGAEDHFIRSHFFSPTKNVFGKMYTTYWVNIFVLWGMSIVLGILLYFDILRKFLNAITLLLNKIK